MRWSPGLVLPDPYRPRHARPRGGPMPDQTDTPAPTRRRGSWAPFLLVLLVAGPLVRWAAERLT